MAIDGTIDINGEIVDDGSSFIAIVPTFIASNYLSHFHLYEKLEISGEKDLYRFRCLLQETTSIPETTLVRMLRSWDCLYIHKNEMEDYDRYLKRNLHIILMNESIDMDKRALLFTEICSEVIQGVMEENFRFPRLDRETLKNLKSLMLKAMGFLSAVDSLKLLANLIGHDYGALNHSVRVGWLMAIFINANRDFFDVSGKSELEKLVVEGLVVGFLHDIGKSKIPRHILNKQGLLTNMEYLVVQAHPSYSASLLFGAKFSRHVMEGILYHHENKDGGGYPFGLKGDKIPLFAKICHIADVFDALALSSRQVYKKSKSPYQTLSIMTGKNPNLDALTQMEQEVWKNTNLNLFVSGAREIDMERVEDELKKNREFEKRVEVRCRLRDKGMSHYFDSSLLKRFVLTLNRPESFDFSNLFSRN